MGRRRPALSESYMRSERKQHKKCVIKWGRLLSVVLLVALTIEVASALLTSPYFSIRKISVSGNKSLSTAQVIRTLDKFKGSNIFRIDKREIVNRLKENPVIKGARVFRRLPNGLFVHVIERKPDAILSVNGKLYLLDSSGIPYRPISQEDRRLTIILCNNLSAVRIGKCISAPEFRVARQCLLQVRKEKLPKITEIYVDQNDGLCLNTRDGFKVILGQPDQIIQKIHEAARVIREIPDFRTKGEYVNVSSPGNPAYKLEE